MIRPTALLAFTILFGAPATAQFGPRNDLHTGTSYWDPLILDMDQDGDNDIVLKDAAQGIGMLENLDGLGSFGPLQVLDTTTAISWLQASDLDGDLDLDLVANRGSLDQLLWFANDGAGVFAPGTVLLGEGGYRALCADLTGSPLDEILFSNDSAVYWFANDGGTFTTMDSLPFGAWVKLFDVGDIDLDGDIDFAVHTPDQVLFGLNPGSGGAWSILAVPGFLATGHTYGKKLTDCDGDGDLDLVDAGWTVRWVENLAVDSGYLAFAPERYVDHFAPNEGAGWAAPLGCGPGASILWCHWVYVGPVYWAHYHTTLGGFSAPTMTNLRSAGDGRMVIGDLNGDERQDVVITHHDTVSWYANELPDAGGSLATVPALDTLCTGCGAYPLPEGNPPNGWWSGSYVEQGSFFDPTAFGQGAGVHPLGYGVVDAQGCIASASTSIRVINEPNIQILDPDPQCPDGELQLVGSPAAGTWSAPADALGRVNTTCAVRPIFTDVSYTYTDVTGHACPGEANVTLDILPCTPVALGPIAPFCVDAPPQPVQLAVPAMGISYFLLGVDSSTYNGGPFVTGWLSGAQGPGTWPVVAAAWGQGECPFPDTVMVEVWPLPAVTFELGVDTLTACDVPLPLGPGAPVGGTYSINGADSAYTVFEVATWGPGTHTVTYTYTDGNGCTGSATDTLVVDCSTGLRGTTPAVLRVWPSPAHDRLFVAFGDAPCNAVLTDAMGRAVARWHVQDAPAVLDVSRLGSGTYLLRLDDGRTRRVLLR